MLSFAHLVNLKIDQIICSIDTKIIERLFLTFRICWIIIKITKVEGCEESTAVITSIDLNRVF